MINKRADGFTLIELLISLFLIVLLSVISIDWVASTYTRVMDYCSQSGHAISLCAAQDQLVRDLYCMVCEQQESSSNFKYVWNRGNDSVGWELVDNKLLRSEGEFNYQAGIWEQGNKSIIADGIESFSLEFMRNDAQIITYVRSTIVSKKGGGPSVREAVMRNRVV